MADNSFWWYQEAGASAHSSPLYSNDQFKTPFHSAMPSGIYGGVDPRLLSRQPPPIAIQTRQDMEPYEINMGLGGIFDCESTTPEVSPSPVTPTDGYFPSSVGPNGEAFLDFVVLPSSTPSSPALPSLQIPLQEDLLSLPPPKPESTSKVQTSEGNINRKGGNGRVGRRRATTLGQLLQPGVFHACKPIYNDSKELAEKISNSIKKVKGKSEYYCDWEEGCKEVFANKQNGRTHINRDHLHRQAMFRCTVCPKTFCDQTSANRHGKAKKCVKCPKCGKMYARSDYLSNHLKNHCH